MQEAYDKAKSVYDDFWDNYQDNGNRTDYFGAFSGEGWTDETYNPKYPINATNRTRLFACSKITDTKVPIIFAGNEKLIYDHNFYARSFDNSISLKTIPSLTVGRNSGEIWISNCPSIEHIGLLGELWDTLDVSSCQELDFDTVIQAVIIAKDFRNDPDPEIQEMADTRQIYVSADIANFLWETLADDYMPEYEGLGLLLGEVLLEKGWLI